MSQRKKTTTTEVTEQGILQKSGLDVTLENIDKRLEGIEHTLANAPTRERVDFLERQIEEAKREGEVALAAAVAKVEKQVETKADKRRFELVERVVYGAVGFILVGVLGAVLTLVLK